MLEIRTTDGGAAWLNLGWIKEIIPGQNGGPTRIYMAGAAHHRGMYHTNESPEDLNARILEAYRAIR